MTNRGIIPGLNTDGWRYYQPRVRAFVALGEPAPAQPVIAPSSIVGRYRRLGDGLYAVEGQLTLASGDTVGSGDNVWGFSLPFPANRWQGGADLPVGVGWTGKGSSPYYNFPIIPTLMDPLAPDATYTSEDTYVQFFIENSISRGTATISGTATSTTVTHNIGYTPNASDINLVITALNNTPANPQAGWVDTITSTQFNINVKQAPGTGTPTKSIDYAWKIRSEPAGTGASPEWFTLLLSSRKPWTYAAGDIISWSLTYEARA